MRRTHPARNRRYSPKPPHTLATLVRLLLHDGFSSSHVHTPTGIGDCAHASDVDRGVGAGPTPAVVFLIADLAADVVLPRPSQTGRQRRIPQMNQGAVLARVIDVPGGAHDLPRAERNNLNLKGF